jgi:hypothetical protein
MRFTIERHGTIVLFTPHDGDALDWLESNVQAEPWQWQGTSLAVDHHYAGAIAEAIAEHDDEDAS